MITAIILVSIVCLTAVVLAVLIMPGLHQGRDMAARDRDYALAKLFEARARLMHIENLERRDAMRRRDECETRLKKARDARQHERTGPGEVRHCDARRGQ